MVAYQDFVALSQSGDSEARGQAAHLAAQAYLRHTGPADEHAALYAALIALPEMPSGTYSCGADLGVAYHFTFYQAATAVATAMWPFRTRVRRSRLSSVGSPMTTVRVMSVVPSTYCPPESTR